MNITIVFTYDYVSKRIKLTWQDIVYAIEKNYLLPDAAIEHAINELSKKEEYPQWLIELASLSKGESVHPLLGELVGLEPIKDTKIVSEKWLYLILRWLFDNKNQYSDSLGIIEQIYADFDYPEIISTFVRYMPSDEPNLGNLELNEARLYEKWKEYLDEQKNRFSFPESDI